MSKVNILKKSVTLFILFVIYSFFAVTNPEISKWDINVITFLQNKFNNIPVFIPVLMDSKLYASLIAIPVLTAIIFFFRKYFLIDLILYSTSPLIAYFMNIVIKNIVQRPRPPIELQIAVQPSTFSFVSSHTLITTTLWGLTIYYLNKYCKNKILKIFGTVFGIIWIMFVGISRIWLGVHNPTDVIGGYFLGLILVYTYINLIKLVGANA